MVRRHSRRAPRRRAPGSTNCTSRRSKRSVSKEVKGQTNPVTATTDYRKLVENPSIDAVMISTTPEPTHYPIAKESLLAGKHVFLEKPIAMELAEADELIALAHSKKLAFTIGYSQRFNPKFAFVKRSIEDGTIGEPCSALVSRHITRNLGKKIGGRVKLSPAAMEATHDIDFVLWCLAPRKPVPRLRAGSPQNHEGPVQRARLRLHHRDHGRRHRVYHRRRLGAASRLSEFFLYLDRVRRHRGRGDGG